MFGKLPDLFDKHFAVGYFLPVATFISMSLWIINEFGALTTILALNTANQVDVLIGTTIIGLVSWLGGVFLLVTNSDILRLMEGYGRFNPARIFHGIEKRRYRKFRKAITKLDEEYLSCISEEREFPQKQRLERNRLMREIVERFPDEEHWLLPTSFGNTIRAFEVYPRRMYGLDSIPGWNRLVGVIPEEYRDLVDNAKAHVDFWANLWLLSLIILVEYIGIAVHSGQAKALWVPFIAFCIALVAFSRARSSAVEWGDLVKSSFDVFLPELRKKLGFPSPATIDEERLLWNKFSQAIIYANPEHVPNRDESQDEDADRTAPSQKGSSPETGG